MKVLVTGSTGFIGTWVVDALKKRGIEVIGFDRSKGDDVLDAAQVDAAIEHSDGVIHLAGVLGTAETVADPWPVFEANVRGALNVFEGCRRHKKRCSYISVGNYWMLSPYPITKTAAESLAFMFNVEHGTEIAVVRVLNAYGPGQKWGPGHPQKIMPSFCMAALRGEPITIFGDGNQLADMIWVGDVAEIMVRALLEDHGQYRFRVERDKSAPVKFHAGTGRPTSVLMIAQLVALAAGSKAGVRFVPPRPGEPERAVVLGNPDSLAPLYHGFAPKLTSLELGLLTTVGWYKLQVDPEQDAR